MDIPRHSNEPEDRMPDDGAGPDAPPVIGTDERRMNVRAYNLWVSLLHGRPYPSVRDIDPEEIADFGPYSVLLDFTGGVDNPAIRFLGALLREECGMDGEGKDGITHVSQVPSRSLLSRLTDHYLQIIANRAPIGFEAEFVGQRGHNTLYRGILMPFSSDGDAIDFIYGVINWKELVDAETQARLAAEIDQARRGQPRPIPTGPIWADGPSAGIDTLPPEPEPEVIAARSLSAVHSEPRPVLAALLSAAREGAATAIAADTRSRAALYRALGLAYGFARAAEEDPDAYRALLDEAGLKTQARAPMTPAVKLVFGAGYDKTRVTEFAAALSHARRNGITADGFAAFLDTIEGGIKGAVRAERHHRRNSDRQSSVAEADARVARKLRSTPSLAHVPVPVGAGVGTAGTGDAAGDGEFVLLLARADGEGALDVVAALRDDRNLLRRAMRRAAA